LFENMFDQKRISANPDPNAVANPNHIIKAHKCFRTDEMMSFFEEMYRYPPHAFKCSNTTDHLCRAVASSTLFGRRKNFKWGQIFIIFFKVWSEK